MRSKFAVALLACVTLFLSGCGSSNKDLLVGKWEADSDGVKIWVEFAKDGTAKFSMSGPTRQGTYKVNGDELEWSIGVETFKFKIKVTATEMELTREGNTIKYKKV